MLLLAWRVDLQLEGMTGILHSWGYKHENEWGRRKNRGSWITDGNRELLEVPPLDFLHISFEILCLFKPLKLDIL